MHLFTKLYISLFCQKVGNDQLGNRYFQEKRAYRLGKPRRFVLYPQKVEASSIPQLWHAWMHYMVQDPPLDEAISHLHRPNVTGTEKALEYNSEDMPSHIRFQSHYTPFNPE